jgi:hypothetical protein
MLIWEHIRYDLAETFARPALDDVKITLVRVV